jgi:hypothetical protein
MICEFVDFKVYFLVASDQTEERFSESLKTDLFGFLEASRQLNPWVISRVSKSDMAFNSSNFFLYFKK